MEQLQATLDDSNWGPETPMLARVASASTEPSLTGVYTALLLVHINFRTWAKCNCRIWSRKGGEHRQCLPLFRVRLGSASDTSPMNDQFMAT